MGKYISWVATWQKHPGFTWALIPDVIEGTEEENDALIAQWPKELAGVPVWHMSETLERLGRLADEWPIVALGSSGVWKHPGSKIWWERVKVFMDYITDAEGRPACKLHGLRMLNPKIFTRLPLSSADNTTAAVDCSIRKGDRRWGSYMPPTSSQRFDVIASRIESHNSPPLWERQNQMVLFNGHP